MNSRRNKKRKAIFQNIFIIFFVSVIVLSAVSYLVSRFYFNEIVKEKFIQNFNSANNHKYTLSIANLNVNILRSYVLIKGAEVKLNDTVNQKVYINSVKIPIIEIRQINLYELIKSNYFQVNAFSIQFPEFNLIYKNDLVVKDSFDTSELLLGEAKDYIKDIDAQFFSIESASIQLKGFHSDSVLFFQENFSLAIDSLHIHANVGAYMDDILTLEDFKQVFLKFHKPEG